jgi:hypothetical protein
MMTRHLICVALAVAGCRATTSSHGPTAASQGRPRSPWTATALAVGATVGGVAAGAIAEAVTEDGSPAETVVVIGSLAIMAAGPSAGHWYAGEHQHALRWTAIRAGGLAAGVVGVWLAFEGVEAESAYFLPAAVLAGFGLTAYMVGVYWDFYDAHRAARRVNARLGLGGSPRKWVVAPAVGRAFGLQVIHTF